MKSLINATIPAITITPEEDGVEITTRREYPEEHVVLYHIRLTAKPRKAHSPICRIEWSQPSVDIHSLWHPGTDRNKAFHIDWGDGFPSRITSLAPVAALFNVQGQNRLTFAFSDALNQLTLKAGIHEEDSTFLCSISLFEEPMPELEVYEATLRLDYRDIPYYEALSSVAAWWETLPGFRPAAVPAAALRPMYSTWYSFHQNLTAAALERQCRLAKDIGCDSIIVDDGWQTEDNSRGYGYTGDWEVCKTKIPDMKVHVEAVHRLGLKYLLWYSVPFVGIYSKVWDRFKDKLLLTEEKLNAGVLDPRFPEVREFLIETYERAVRDWNIDGLKLDFVDSFRLTYELNRQGACEGQDYRSVPEAVDRLLSDVMIRLRAIKPDILIEFRQTYIGPLMRKYGNMFRANDCPNDFIQNRIRTLDLRLLSGNTAVHSDMIMFNYNETAENAALQLINVLFSVPQISVRLEELGSEHLDMLRHWLSFCAEHREVLLQGELAPRCPELLYPIVWARKDERQIVALYASMVVELGDEFNQLTIVNGTSSENVVIKPHLSPAVYKMEIKDCCGRTIGLQSIEIGENLFEAAVPKAGSVRLTRMIAEGQAYVKD
ncbi:glycoside hydrolase family 36 protein [Paenibacillus macerans]|uniref:glycoside hydrolase family 36 protein n=1 Tax=Paenibacillus macerans TaxID=44252 RepID=UPI003D3182E7